MLLSVEDFSLGFRRYTGLLNQTTSTALHGLNLTLERGEVLALVGASGAGKSLLAHAIFDVLPRNAHTTGRLRMDGKELDRSNWADYRGKRMGLVPQSSGHLDPLTRCGRQLGWAAQRSGRRFSKSDLHATLARFGLDASAARAFPHELSGGMARRMMLAIATIREPDLVVADEPTSGLDGDNARVVLGYLRELADSQKGVLLITHDLTTALPFADRVAILRNGRLAGLEQASEFYAEGQTLTSPYSRALWRAMPENTLARENA